ncbi:MAG: ABC transporter permease [Candidatus Aminicenantes bacterium]|nr:ABC transporter permease [Candidatus Aminicenantes bacterium]
MMFNLEEEIKKWRKNICQNPHLTEEDVTELESHIREEITKLVDEGIDAEAAFKAAAGKPDLEDVLADEYRKFRKLAHVRSFWQPFRFMPSLTWNYMKIALRKIRRHKGYSIINILGLSLGIACAILIFLWIDNEMSFDRFHAKADKIYRAVTEQRDTGVFDHYAVTPRAMGRTLKEEVPEIVRASRFMDTKKQFNHNGFAAVETGAYVDPDFLRIFSFPHLHGDPNSALNDPQSVVLTASLARKYFRDENPIGRSMTTMNKMDLRVTGVVRDVPPQSHLRFDYLVPFQLFERRLPVENQWNDVSYYTYIELGDRASFNSLEEKITASVRRHKPAAEKTEYHLQPLKRIHLYSDYKFDLAGHGDIAQVLIFSAVALFILIIACLNFVSLSTARSYSRSREVGIRKAVGAGRSELVRQFIGESVLLTLIAFALALTAIELALPSFSAFTGNLFQLAFRSGHQVWLGLLAIVVFVSLASGLYPALFLSAFPAVFVLKSDIRTGSRKGGFRRSIVIFQFTISVFLIIGTLIISRQVRYLRNRPLGYDPDHLIILPLEGSIARNPQAAKTEFLRNPAVLGACLLDILPIHEGNGTNDEIWESMPEGLKLQMRIGFVDEDYMETFRIQLAAGRFIGVLRQTESQDHIEDIVLNESAVRAMGLENPIGKRFSRWEGRPGSIVGVVKDFQLLSAQHPVEPLILTNDPTRFSKICLRINPDRVPETIKSLEATWKKLNPEYPFHFTFYDQAVDALYHGEQRLGKLCWAMTAIAFVIACLGLFGLVSYLAEQRTKEIGIRKVLGASIPGIFILISKEFLQCVGIANLLAWPAAYFFSRSWLQNFAHRTPLGIDVFFLSAGLSLIIALITVGGQALRAARVNPVQHLRYE